MDSIKKEMDIVNIAFDFLDQDNKMPLGYSEITCHLVFTEKFDLTRKSRYVAGEHLAPSVPKFLTYLRTVSRESACIAFTVTALNGLDIIVGDISHAYLHAKIKEKYSSMLVLNLDHTADDKSRLFMHCMDFQVVVMPSTHNLPTHFETT